MIELNHIILNVDLLTGSHAPHLPPTSSVTHTVFDLKAGGLFKVDDQNVDRAQLLKLDTK